MTKKSVRKGRPIGYDRRRPPACMKCEGGDENYLCPRCELIEINEKEEPK